MLILILFSSITGDVRTYNVTLRRVRATIVAVEKLYVLHIVSVCVSVCVFGALGIQHAMRIRHIIICGLSDSTVL